ncbi:MAG: methyltransferase domain-containing protein [Rhodospirillales bacterium]|nr:methyltransferase domain-containing protein [Rhodospirillales bacterium]
MTRKRVYGLTARLYDILDLPFELGRYRPLRAHLFSGLSGHILDAGVGTGRNMEFYPQECSVTGIDLSPSMLDRAAKRRARLGLRVELLEMDVCRTTFPDNHFDAVVATFLFCVLDENQQLPALKELSRLCKPDGEIRIIEYAYSRNPVRRLVMRLWAPWVRAIYGAAFDRETERYVPGAGLRLVERRFLYQDIIKLLILKTQA